MPKRSMTTDTQLFLLTALVLLLFPVAVIHGQTFNRNLSVGSVGEDVRNLQKQLNQNPTTQLAMSGPGSSGSETSYFGILTQAALIRFQNLHRESILVPLGLSQGTGFFGPSTRSFVASFTTQQPTITFSETTNQTPNKETMGTQLQKLARDNFDAYAAIVRENLGDSLSAGETERVLENIEENIEEADYAVFFERKETPTVDEVLEKMEAAGASPGQQTEEILREVLEQPGPVSSLFRDLFFPQMAHAQTAYGSLLNVPYPCTCTGGTVWQMYITGYIQGIPTEFSLDYIVGTQGFLSYTLPIAQHQLGLFVPAGVSCWQVAFPCVVIPSAGTVSPIVGSSTI